jgi:hypothetical protein
MMHDEVLLLKPIRVRTSEDANKTLQDTFCDSRMYFNHFVKFCDCNIISQKYLWGLIACGAAGVCADFQYGIDIIIPFLYKDNVLGHRNVSALPLFIQSKNDKTFQAKPHVCLFTVT